LTLFSGLNHLSSSMESDPVYPLFGRIKVFHLRLLQNQNSTDSLCRSRLWVSQEEEWRTKPERRGTMKNIFNSPVTKPRVFRLLIPRPHMGFAGGGIENKTGAAEDDEK
jgi:hypothetical protein